MNPEPKTLNPPEALTVFYDAHCEFCRRSRAWLEKQPAYLGLRFVPYQAPHATVLCPRLAEFHPEKEIVVISRAAGMSGSSVTQVYTGASAWVMCLYATRKYRELSLRLAHPALMPLARKVCHLVSQNRYTISALFGKHPEEIARELDALAAMPLSCATRACERGLYPGTLPPLPLRK